jgi:hypothetical protein
LLRRKLAQESKTIKQYRIIRKSIQSPRPKTILKDKNMRGVKTGVHKHTQHTHAGRLEIRRKFPRLWLYKPLVMSAGHVASLRQPPSSGLNKRRQLQRAWNIVYTCYILFVW